MRASRPLALTPRQLFGLPPLGGYRVTARRVLNLYLNRLEYLRGRTRLRSYPTRLVVEPASACNLRCPYCLTGAGEVGRARGVMTLALYERLLDELGPWLFELEAFHWGEPLLNPHLDVMIEAATARGIATTVNTSFSVPFDRDRAERLVAAGLGELTVSVDGATQQTYERYRVRGDLARVRENCRLIDEIGDTLLLVELFNWGEALLHPKLPELIAAASTRDIATRVNTNLSVRFTSRDAERLVESGLTDLFVSVDGATQEVYERYRVGGDLAKVVANCRLVAEAKRRLGRTLPRLTLQFLEFPCNVGEGDAIRRLAAELDMRLFALRGAVPDPAWATRSGWPPWFLEHAPHPCPFLWGEPVLTVDGNLASCRGVFQDFDDFAPLAGSFQDAWNAPRFQAARRLFHRRGDGAGPAEPALPCWDCPTHIFYDRWRTHRAAGGTLETFDPRMTLNANGAWNYFWSRGQRRRAESQPAVATALAARVG